MKRVLYNVESMSALLILLAAVLTCGVIAGQIIRRRRQQRTKIPNLNIFAGISTRRLDSDERSAIEGYLDSLAHISGTTHSGALPASLNLQLLPQSSTVYRLCHSITRYGLSTENPAKWRYYLDAVEIHLPPFWEQYITDNNEVEVVLTGALPLVISLNGHSLLEPVHDTYGTAAENATTTQAFIRGEESEQIELLMVRNETKEEYLLNRPDRIREALPIGASFILCFFCLNGPTVLLPWLAGSAVLLLVVGLWRCFAPPSQLALQEIHCLRGTPKRWGLFGESNQEQMNTVSLGIIDLIYPAHWQPWINHDLGQKTDIDVYLDHRVVRQGRFLSLHDEVKNFPLQNWMRSLLISFSALLVLAMMVLWGPLDMPLKIMTFWLKDSQTVEATSVNDLERSNISVGDTLKVRGKGMCSINLLDNYSNQQNLPFRPFDCSKIIWNNAPSLPVPHSTIVAKALTLNETVKYQLNPDKETSKISPALHATIQKSGMILLNDFSEIVKKTQLLCTEPSDCVRLKNALVNLNNVKDWETLTQRTNSSMLDHTNVLLRPVSAEALSNLVTMATVPFIQREILHAAQTLNNPVPRGFIIISDEGSDLVAQLWPAVKLNDLPAQEQWQTFKRLAETFIQTPFSAEGIVTGIQIDPNNTVYINLHSVPDIAGLWRYIGTSLIMIAMTVCALWHGVLSLRRYRHSRTRLANIHRYYETCLNERLPSSDKPMLF